MNNGRKSPEVVVITGASAGVGVGRAAARAFAEQGALILLVAPAVRLLTIKISHAIPGRAGGQHGAARDAADRAG